MLVSTQTDPGRKAVLLHFTSADPASGKGVLKRRFIPSNYKSSGNTTRITLIKIILE